MSGNCAQSAQQRQIGFLRTLASDASGNTLALMAAAMLPLLGIIGGGIDMSRSYLAQTRLQQACDAGVLAARKHLGSHVAVDGHVPDETAEVGDRFFDLNFRDKSYATENREFQLFLEDDTTLTGEASVTVPTAVMNVFGFDEVNIAVECAAVLSFQNLDLMLVLDTTGSMRHTNDGDPLPRIDTMKQVVRDFHEELEANKGPGVRLRYGFVPYATNVNVGHLLRDEWVASEWTYQSRVLGGTTKPVSSRSYSENWVTVSGTAGPEVLLSSYAPTFHAGTPPANSGSVDQADSGGTPGYYTCDQPTPPGAVPYAGNTEILSTASEPYPGPPSGTKTTEKRRASQHGFSNYQSYDGTNCNIFEYEYKNYVRTYDFITHPAYAADVNSWIYRPVTRNVQNWRSETDGCIEERATYEIDDYDNIDLTRALDLDLDLVPTPGDVDTQWRPRYPNLIYVRALDTVGAGLIKTEEVTSTETFAQTGTWGISACPAPARRLAEMDAAALNSYLTTLYPGSQTYHDIGMIWGGRLLSPTGLFKGQNKDVSDTKPTNRNLIFLTDGQTEPFITAYGAYGIDPLDERRWTLDSTPSLAQTVEARFLAACKEVKKRNITVWVIAFGTELNPAMTECAGEGHYFEAGSASKLSEAFKTIAASLGDLRISE